MVSIGKVHGDKNGGRVLKSALVAKLSGLDVELDPDFQFGKHNRNESFLKKFPLGKIPAYEGNDGFLLTESNAIAYYLASKIDGNPLLGKDITEQAKILQFMFFSEGQVMPSVVNIFLNAYGIIPYIKEVEENEYKKLYRSLEYLDQELKDKKFLVSDRLTLADIVVAFDLSYFYAHFMAKEHREQFPNITRYIKEFYLISEVKEVAGEVQFAEKRKTYVPKE